MNQNPAISDDPLPEGELVARAQANSPDAPPNHPLPSPVHSDPHSLAAISTTELHDPELHRNSGGELAAPDLHEEEQPLLAEASRALVAAPDLPVDAVVIQPSNTHALNAHMAQVGLTSSDQWEEHFQPRIQKLTEDIALVHVELDKLERKKSTR